MTQEQKDAAWKSMPKDIQKEIRSEFDETPQFNECMYDNGWDNATRYLLMKLFGKHNLTASEEEKPMFKVGDIVKVSRDMNGGSGESDKNKEILLNVPSIIIEIQGENALIEGAGGSVYGLIPLKYLIPYTEEQPKPKTIHIRTKHGTVAIPTKIEYDDSFWLAYRMELAKEVAVELIRSGRDATFLAESTSLIVDGIVRRLKGGDK